MRERDRETGPVLFFGVRSVAGRGGPPNLAAVIGGGWSILLAMGPERQGWVAEGAPAQARWPGPNAAPLPGSRSHPPTVPPLRCETLLPVCAPARPGFWVGVSLTSLVAVAMLDMLTWQARCRHAVGRGAAPARAVALATPAAWGEPSCPAPDSRGRPSVSLLFSRGPILTIPTSMPMSGGTGTMLGGPVPAAFFPVQ
jgi:hypothetical protein